MLNPDKLGRKKADPTAKGEGRAGVLPDIEHIERAFVPLDDTISRQMAHDYRHGRERGQTTNNKYLDPYFTWMPGYTNVITGWGGHGKSQLFFELLLARATYDGKKSVVWPSENLPAQRFYDGLIHTLTGRSVDKTYANCLTLAEYERAQAFIREHFLVLDPPTGMGYTPAHLLAYFEAAVARTGAEHCMLDPWNKCDHTAQARLGGPEAYLGHTLGLCTKWSQDTRQCLVITAHPKRDTENMGYGKTRPVPTGGTISGGQMWENMAHYIGAMHRPYDFIEDSTAAAFYTHKCKDERLVGKRGSIGAGGKDGTPPMVPINWDSVSNRYRWGHERWSPLDNPEFKAIWAAPSPVLLPALGFDRPAPPLAPTPVTASGLVPGVGEVDTIPDDFNPNGRIIRLPHANGN